MLPATIVEWPKASFCRLSNSQRFRGAEMLPKCKVKSDTRNEKTGIRVLVIETPSQSGGKPHETVLKGNGHIERASCNCEQALETGPCAHMVAAILFAKRLQ